MDKGARRSLFSTALSEIIKYCRISSGVVDGTLGTGAMGFLESPTCNQDENHFNSILTYLLNSDEWFRRRVLEHVFHISVSEPVSDFLAVYQQSSVSSRPDLKVRFSTAACRYLLFIETKVQSPVDLDQLRR